MNKLSKTRVLEEVGNAKNKRSLSLFIFSIGVLISFMLLNNCIFRAQNDFYPKYCLFEKNLTYTILSIILIIVGFFTYTQYEKDYKKWKNQL